MKLNELFDKFDLSKAKIIDVGHEYIVKAKIERATIEFGASRLTAKSKKWTIDFSELYSSDDMEGGEEYREYGLTNKGNEFKVMQFIVACVRQFVDKYDPEVIMFTAAKKNQSRAKLYARIVNRMKSEYVVKVADEGVEDQFTLTKRVDSIKEAREFSNSELGELSYGWKSKKELAAEEDNKLYIPTGYDKVLELGGIFAAEPGKGQGDKLMKQFLNSPEAKKADLIFCDPVPGLGANFKSDMSDGEQIERLMKFYRRFGFRNNPKSNRMWLVKKGSIPDNRLPT